MPDDIIITISSLIPFHLNPHAFWMSPVPNRFVFLLSCRSHSTYHTSFPAIYYYIMYLRSHPQPTPVSPLKARTIHDIILHLYSLRYILHSTCALRLEEDDCHSAKYLYTITVEQSQLLLNIIKCIRTTIPAACFGINIGKRSSE